MSTFTRILSIVVLALAGSATVVPNLFGRDDATSPCDGAAVVSNTTIQTGDSSVLLTTFSCSSKSLSPLVNAYGLPTTKTLTATHTDTVTIVSTDTATATVTTTEIASPSPTPTPLNVCGNICEDSCGSIGQLPPISEDCATIVDAITILNGSSSPSFVVSPGNVQQLTFGTCRFFFENLSTQDIQYCWTDLSNQASAAGAACLPPIQPVNTLGLCTPASGLWEVGIGHS